MERFQKQVPLIEVAQMYIARDQRFIWLYTPLILLIPIFQSVVMNSSSEAHEGELC